MATPLLRGAGRCERPAPGERRESIPPGFVVSNGSLQVPGAASSASGSAWPSSDWIADATRSVANSTRSVADSTRSVTDSTRSVADSTRSVTDSTQFVADSTRSVTDSTQSVADSTRSVADSTQSVADSTRSVTDSTRSVADSTRSVVDRVESVPREVDFRRFSPISRRIRPISTQNARIFRRFPIGRIGFSPFLLCHGGGRPTRGSWGGRPISGRWFSIHSPASTTRALPDPHPCLPKP